MNSKIKKVGLVISIIIVVIILADLLFNLSGVLNERFNNRSNIENGNGNGNGNGNEVLGDRFNAAAGSNANGNNETEDVFVRSIESVFSGARYNVVALPFNTKVLPITNINIKSSSFSSLKVSNDLITRVPSNYSDNSQKFKLVKMESMRDVIQFISEGTFVPAQEDEFPYYFIKAPGPSNKVLSVGDTDLSVLRPNNRTNQRFYVDSDEHNSLDNKGDDTIDIKIKLDQESINTIIDKMGISDINNTAAGFNNNGPDLNMDCNRDNWIPRDAVKSMCGYCDPDLID